MARAAVRPAWRIFSVATLPVFSQYLICGSNCRETSPMPCNVAAACCLTRPQRVLTCWMTALVVATNLFALLDKLLENLLLFHCRFGEQMMVLDAVINLLRFLDSRLRRLYAAPSELLQGPLDPLGHAFQDPRLVRIPDCWFLHRRIREVNLAVGKTHCRRGADDQRVDCSPSCPR